MSGAHAGSIRPAAVLDRKRRPCGVEARAGVTTMNRIMAPEEPTDLHGLRLAAVTGVLRARGSRRVADLGCGPGALFERLAAGPDLQRLVAVDLSLPALQALRGRMDGADDRLRFLHGSFLDPGLDLGEIDAAVLLETIEHIDPDQLSRLERAVFARWRPRVVIITTPNADYNPVLGVPPGRRRHWDHRFEWGREHFARWASGVAARQGYAVQLQDIGPVITGYGAATQMAIFDLGGG